MQLDFACKSCQQVVRAWGGFEEGQVVCPACGDARVIPEEAWDGETLRRCLACGDRDLWRQKDFPQLIGLAIVATGIGLSTIAWWQFRPEWAIGILMLFALADLALYSLMRDVLVCYRCQARHRLEGSISGHERFNHETAEKHRQESLRHSERESSPGDGPSRHHPA